MKLFCLLFLSVIFFIFCNGQTKTQSPKNNISEPGTVPVGQPTIIKTQGTDRYANVYCSIQDKSSNLWFGTSGEGIYRFNGKSFTNFTWEDGLSSNDIGAILEDKKGCIWVGTNRGVCRYNGKSFTRFPLPGDDSIPGRVTFSKSIFSMLEDKTGNIWFGTRDHGVYRYDGKSFANFLSSEVVKCILEDKAGNIWFGSWSRGGVYRLDASRANHPCIKNSCKHDLNNQQEIAKHYEEINKSFTNFRIQDGISEDMISDIIEDKAGNIWFTTRDHGVCCYNGKSFTSVTEKDGLCSNYLTCILEDKTGNLWFGHDGKWGAEGHGVCRYNLLATFSTGSKSFTNFTTKDGLSNNNVFTILEDKTGNLWFGSRNVGLCRYDGKSFTDFSDHGSKQ